MTDMSRLTEGSIVHYVLPDGRNEGDCRPAIVVRVWGDADGKPQENGVCQLQVFVDGTNDYPDDYNGSVWATSVVYSDDKEPGTWHWLDADHI